MAGERGQRTQEMTAETRMWLEKDVGGRNRVIRPEEKDGWERRRTKDGEGQRKTEQAGEGQIPEDFGAGHGKTVKTECRRGRRGTDETGGLWRRP